MNTDLTLFEGEVLQNFDQALNPAQLARVEERESALARTETSKQVERDRSALVMAKQFRRNEVLAFSNIMKTCQRPTFAKSAIYKFPRGGKNVEGASIRMAEALARAWGNLKFGVREIEQADGYSVVEAYAWDLETNTEETRMFTVVHERDTKQGSKKLDANRDIYEMVYNQAMRRVRACILALIPQDIIEEALAACRRTIAGDSKEPLTDRVRKAALLFEQSFSVTQEMLEKRLGHPLAQTSSEELVDLIGIFNSLKDNASRREDWFEVTGNGAPRETTKTASVNDALGLKK